MKKGGEQSLFTSLMRIDVVELYNRKQQNTTFIFVNLQVSKQTFNMYTTIKYNGRSVFNIMFRLMWGTVFIFKFAKRLGC